MRSFHGHYAKNELTIKTDFKTLFSVLVTTLQYVPNVTQPEVQIFVSVIGKFLFTAPSGSIGFLSPQQVGGLTRFIFVRYSLFNCFV